MREYLCFWRDLQFANAVKEEESNSFLSVSSDDLRASPSTQGRNMTDGGQVDIGSGKEQTVVINKEAYAFSDLRRDINRWILVLTQFSNQTALDLSSVITVLLPIFVSVSAFL
ncbi:hypothetical protein L6452_00223 [Arctium lappa]|uniref:Uncharacterized protein n=1 Tax=Arctium lappa TaxID=4217 RepID=A0ACB9FDX7_ARCLA|nr:hypothetical protein L6452_00223 [Arctium lappa]